MEMVFLVELRYLETIKFLIMNQLLSLILDYTVRYHLMFILNSILLHQSRRDGERASFVCKGVVVATQDNRSLAGIACHFMIF